MIYGIGTDILRMDRIASTYERFGEHFVDRLLMPAERVLFDRARNPVRFLAMRFAAKEAIVKAMGTGFRQRHVAEGFGRHAKPIRPAGHYFFGARPEKCNELEIAGGYLTLSDEAGLIVAVAVLERKDC